jgi:Ca-activated chloride channel homolog
MIVSRKSAVIAALLIALNLPAVALAQEGSSQAGASRPRRLAEAGCIPAPEEIVVEHFVNYHRHGIRLPRAGEDIAVELRWDAPGAPRQDRSVLQIGLATAHLHDVSHAPPLDLALVVDCSSSMRAHDKMSRVKAALSRFLVKLRPLDRVSIVAYANEARVVLEPTLFEEGDRVRAAVRELEPNGSTNLHAGLMLGYRMVARHRRARANHRVILLTDGIANTGVTDPETIALDSRRYNREGIDLSTIGVGLALNRDLLATLARSGRGLFHFVADQEDLSKVFDQEFQSLLGAVARDIELRVTHDAGLRITRVFGYEPRRMENGFRVRLEDFNHGLTNVVLVEFAREGWDEDPGRSRVQVRLSYRKARDENAPRRVLTQETRFLDPRNAGGRVDHEVRKNVTIAIMASALRRMAEAARADRPGEAERHVSLALEYVRRYYPSTTDADLVRVRSLLETYRRVLDARIERFRDL